MRLLMKVGKYKKENEVSFKEHLLYGSYSA